MCLKLKYAALQCWLPIDIHACSAIKVDALHKDNEIPFTCGFKDW
jgi:hypothetical protein